MIYSAATLVALVFDVYFYYKATKEGSYSQPEEQDLRQETSQVRSRQKGIHEETLRLNDSFPIDTSYPGAIDEADLAMRPLRDGPLGLHHYSE